MDEKIILRSKLFGGFNKQDVLQYIDLVTSKSASQQIMLNEKNDNLEDSILLLEEKLKKSEQVIIDLEKELEEKNNDIKFLSNNYNALRESNKQCDQIIRDVGRIMLSAKNSADEIIIEAEQKAKDMSCEIISTLKNSSNDLYTCKNEIDKLKSSVKNTFYATETQLSVVSNNLENVTRKINGFSNDSSYKRENQVKGRKNISCLKFGKK